MVVGGCAVDMTCTVAPHTEHHHHPLTRSSYPGELQRTLGGVGCNIARVAHQCGIPTHLVSIVGQDTDGHWIKQTLKAMDLTAVYNAIHEADGQLYVAVACMDIFDQL
ncbi:hypothetical protein SYNPS1DRAFT_5207, partial [Syncephalis pseudoplumigaleata]